MTASDGFLYCYTNVLVIIFSFLFTAGSEPGQKQRAGVADPRNDQMVQNCHGEAPS